MFCSSFYENQNIIPINNDKYIKFLGQNIIDITLKADQSIKKVEKYYLILKLFILSQKNRLLFIAFFTLFFYYQHIKLNYVKR